MENVHKDRSALVFIEFQREWLDPEGTLARLLVQDKPAFGRAVENAAGVLAAARANGWLVAHAGLDMRHDPGYLLFGAGKGGERLGLRGVIPRAGTWTGSGAEFAEPFVPREGEFPVRGRSGASAFKNSTLDPFLRNNGVSTVFLLGFATHVCVESSLREAHDLGYDAWLVHDGCAAFTAEQHEHVRRHVVHHFGAEVDAATLIQRMEA
ncbi:MAG: cysteine hydrolase [Desulfovibrionaceae bacterium]